MATTRHAFAGASSASVSSCLIRARANPDQPNMGLTTWKNADKGRPLRKADVGTAKNYLGEAEKVVPHVQESVKLIRGFIVVQTHRPTRPEVTRELVEAWYRDRAHIKFPERIELCLGHFADPEAFRPKGLIVRQTRQRWGSMSPAGRLLLNRRLVQAPVDAIDYVITHELCHVAEPHHGAAFFELLDKVMPDWERRKQRLERAMA